MFVDKEDEIEHCKLEGSSTKLPCKELPCKNDEEIPGEDVRVIMMNKNLKETPSKKVPSIFEEEAEKVKVVEKLNVEVDNEDVHHENSSSKLDRKTRLLEKEAARKMFEKQALIFPEELLNEEEEIAPIAVDNVECLVATSSPPHVPTTEVVPKEPLQLTPDMIGLYTLALPVQIGSDIAFLSSLQEDISWFDTPVSLLTVELVGGVGGATIEIKLRDKDMALAVLNGLRQKYPGLEGDCMSTNAVSLQTRVLLPQTIQHCQGHVLVPQFYFDRGTTNSSNQLHGEERHRSVEPGNVFLQ